MQHVPHHHASRLFTNAEDAKTDADLISIRISKYSEGKETVADVKRYAFVYTDVNYREWNVF